MDRYDVATTAALHIPIERLEVLDRRRRRIEAALRLGIIFAVALLVCGVIGAVLP